MSFVAQDGKLSLSHSLHFDSVLVVDRVGQSICKVIQVVWDIIVHCDVDKQTGKVQWLTDLENNLNIFVQAFLISDMFNAHCACYLIEEGNMPITRAKADDRKNAMANQLVSFLICRQAQERQVR